MISVEIKLARKMTDIGSIDVFFLYICEYFVYMLKMLVNWQLTKYLPDIIFHLQLKMNYEISSLFLSQI